MRVVIPAESSQEGPEVTRGMNDHVLHTDLGRTPITLVRGEGVYVYDNQGNRYLDAVGGVGVVNVGHGVKEIVTAIADQARTLAFSYAANFENQPSRALASM